jgi:hypothetical protein
MKPERHGAIACPLVRLARVQVAGGPHAVALVSDPCPKAGVGEGLQACIDFAVVQCLDHLLQAEAWTSVRHRFDLLGLFSKRCFWANSTTSGGESGAL